MSLLEPYPPEDFEAFWRQAWSEVASAPLDFVRTRHNDYPLDGFSVERIDFRALDGARLSGWIAIPDGGVKLPGFFWVPPYGRESKLPDQYGTRSNFVSLSVNLLGADAFHQEKYHPSRGYFAEGAESPETWIFRTLWQRCAMAMRVLQAQIEVDEGRLASMGLSQGAGLSIWLGAWCPLVKAVVADMPFLGAMRETMTRNAYRYPLKELVDFMDSRPLGRELVMHTLSYYDTLNQATACHVPTQVSFGLKDPACRPDTVQAIYGALPGAKRLLSYDWGHDWHPDMIQKNLDWLNAHV
ncbi:MAG: acetylxylan esterase [Armatimonadetes bacterium]|nr:acetylxylan esterase [Armatimonadota bacterium]